MRVDGQHRSVFPAFGKTFLAGHDDAQAVVAGEIKVRRGRVEIIDFLSRFRIIQFIFRRRDDAQNVATTPSCAATRGGGGGRFVSTSGAGIFVSAAGAFVSGSVIIGIGSETLLVVIGVSVSAEGAGLVAKVPRLPVSHRRDESVGVRRRINLHPFAFRDDFRNCRAQ